MRKLLNFRKLFLIVSLFLFSAVCLTSCGEDEDWVKIDWRFNISENLWNFVDVELEYTDANLRTQTIHLKYSDFEIKNIEDSIYDPETKTYTEHYTYNMMTYKKSLCFDEFKISSKMVARYTLKEGVDLSGDKEDYTLKHGIYPTDIII